MYKKFTLIELIVVIAILAILSSIVIPNVSNFKEKSIATSISSSIKTFQTAVDIFALDHNGELPTKVAPSLESPQLLDFEKLYPSYISNLPKQDNGRYWVDSFGKIWGSTLDIPQHVSQFDKELVFDNNPNSLGYRVYEVQKKHSTGAVQSNVSINAKSYFTDNQADVVTYPMGDTNTTYLVSYVDLYGLETVPVGIDNNVLESFKDIETGQMVSFPISKPGTYTFRVGGNELSYWDKFLKQEDKPEGTSITYSFASSMNGKSYTNYVTSIDQLQPSNYIKIKIDLTANPDTGETPILYWFKVLFHHNQEGSTATEANIVDQIGTLVFPTHIEMATNEKYSKVSFCVPVSNSGIESFIQQVNILHSTPEGSEVVTSYQTSSDGCQTLSDPSGNPRILPKGSYVYITVEMTREWIYIPHESKPVLAASPVVYYPSVFSSVQRPTVQTSDPNQSIDLTTKKEIAEKDSWVNVESFEVLFDAGEVKKWTTAEISDYQPDKTRILYFYAIGNRESDNSLQWSSFKNSIQELNEGSVIKVRVSKQKLKSSSVEPEFYEIALSYAGMSSSNNKVILTGKQTTSLQQLITAYYMEHGSYPTTVQPTADNPQPLQLDLIGWKNSSSNIYYWVDYKGKVWMSTLPSPYQLAINQNVISWTAIPMAIAYNVYEVVNGKNVFVQQITNSTFVGEFNKKYVITSLDKQNNESAPSTPITLKQNLAPTAVITTNIVGNAFNLKDTVQWLFTKSTDPEQDMIVRAEWEYDYQSISIPPSTFNTIGSHTVELRVQDSNGNWSEWTTFNFTVYDSLLDQFTKIIYVDSTNGNDTTGTGTVDAPYKTITKATSVATSGNAVYLKGTYTLGLGYVFKTGVSFIGDGLNTVLKGAGWGGTNVGLYRLVLNGSGYVEGYTFTGSNFNLYNIAVINQNSGDSVRELLNNFTGNVENSSFVSGNWNQLTYGTVTTTQQNNVIGVSLSSTFFAASSAKFDASYHLTSPTGKDTTYGVYGGKYSWN